MKRLIFAVIVSLLVCPAVFADVVFSDDFSADTIGTLWTVNVSGANNYAGISPDGYVTYSLVNSGYAYLYSSPFAAAGDISFSGQVFAGSYTSYPVLTQSSDVAIFNSSDPSKYFKVSYAASSNTLRFVDSGTLVDEISWADQPSFSWKDYSLQFNGSEWAFYQGASSVWSRASSAMDGAGSYFLGIGASDALSNNNFTLFDNVSVTANTVPEPVSTALFILGGATLAAKRLRRKMKCFVFAVLFAALAAAPVFADEANMVYNPGFQLGGLSGWGTGGSGVWLGPGGQDSTNAAYAWIGGYGWQDIAITDPLQTLKISGWVSDIPEDKLGTSGYVSFRLEFKDSSGNKLSEWDSAKIYGTGLGLSWTELTGYATPGAGVTKATLVWETQGSGTGTGKFDNFSVSAVPEPVSMALFLLGGVTLAARRLRRK